MRDVCVRLGSLTRDGWVQGAGGTESMKAKCSKNGGRCTSWGLWGVVEG